MRKVLLVGFILSLGFSFISSSNSVINAKAAEITPRASCFIDENGNSICTPTPPSTNYSGTTTATSNNWFNYYQFNKNIGNFTLNGVKYVIYLPSMEQMVTSSRIYVNPLTLYSTSTNVDYSLTETVNYGASGSLTITTSASVAANVSTLFGGVEAEVEQAYSFEVSAFINWTKSTTVNYHFENPRFFVDNYGILNYVQCRIVQYTLYIPLKVFEYRNYFGQQYLSRVYYIVKPMKSGLIMQWDDGLIQSWYSTQGTVTLSEFYNPFVQSPSSIWELF